MQVAFVNIPQKCNKRFMFVSSPEKNLILDKTVVDTNYLIDGKNGLYNKVDLFTLPSTV